MKITDDHEQFGRAYWNVRPGEHEAIEIALLQMVAKWNDDGHGFEPGYISTAKKMLRENFGWRG